jgi:hypothetical protein
MSEKVEFETAKVARVVNFKCGCMATRHLVGNLEGLRAWETIPCKHHNREEVAEHADLAWYSATRIFDEYVGEKL